MVKQNISITTPTTGSTIYYTIDGSNPVSSITGSSLQYSGPISVTGNGTTKTIKAIAVKSGMVNSQVVSATYTIQYTINLNNGLVAYYPFHNSAEDWSGNKNHGTINGGVTATTDRFGNANKAYSFDGSSGYVSVAHSQSINFISNSQFSSSAWVKLDTLSRIQAIIVKGPDSWNWGLYYIPSQYNKFMTGSYLGWELFSNNTPTISSWYFVTCSYNNGNWKLYVNGIFEKSIMSNLVTHSTANLAVGRKGEASGDYFNGKLDDICIYNRALNDQEVEALYNESAQPPIVTNQTITIDSVTTTSLKLNWTKALDESTYQSKLQYRAFYSTSNNLDTVKNIEANGTPVGDWMTDATSVTVNNLTANTMYYFNVIVRDGGGNKAGYTSKSQTTSP